MTFGITITKDGKVVEGTLDETRAPIPFAGLPDEQKAKLAEYARNALVAVVGEHDLVTAISGLIFALSTIAGGTGTPLRRIAATFEMMSDDDDAESRLRARAALHQAVAFRDHIMRHSGKP